MIDEIEISLVWITRLKYEKKKGRCQWLIHGERWLHVTLFNSHRQHHEWAFGVNAMVTPWEPRTCPFKARRVNLEGNVQLRAVPKYTYIIYSSNTMLPSEFSLRNRPTLFYLFIYLECIRSCNLLINNIKDLSQCCHLLS